MSPLRFLIDESADTRLGAVQTALGHDVKVVARDYGRGRDDEDVLAIAYAEQRILIASDLDFGELIVRHGQLHAGIILFRVEPPDFQIQRARLQYVLTRHQHELDCLLIVSPRRVRVVPRHG